MAKWRLGPDWPPTLYKADREVRISALVKGPETTYPISWRDIVALFDPDGVSEVDKKCRNAHFLHLYGQIWRHSKIPVHLRPPEGSYLDILMERHKVEFTHQRMNFDDIVKSLEWTKTF